MKSVHRGTKKKQATQPVVTLGPLSASLPLALMRAREAVMSYFRPNHREQGITDPQWRVLRVLYQAGSMEVTELANNAVLLPPSVSRILRDFEASGLIERCHVEGDLRRSLVRITPAGVARLAAGADEVNAAYKEIAHRFGQQRMNQLLKLLAELEAALAQGSEEAKPAHYPEKRRTRRKPPPAK